MGKGDLEAIWKEVVELRNKSSQDVPSGLLGVGSKGLQGWPLTRDKKLPYVRHSQFQPAPMDSSLAKTEHISNTDGTSVVTF